MAASNVTEHMLLTLREESVFDKPLGMVEILVALWLRGSEKTTFLSFPFLRLSCTITLDESFSMYNSYPTILMTFPASVVAV